MTLYKIDYSRAAAKELEKLSNAVYEPIRKKIEALVSNPKPHGCKKLKGVEGLYRIRVGDYRVIYEIRSGQLVILVVRVAHRKDAYWDT